MLKIIGGLFIILGIAGVGYSVSLSQKNRIKTLSYIKGDLSIIMSELLYNKSTFYDAIKKLNSNISPVYDEILKALDNNNSVKTAWNFAFTKFKDKIYLCDDDLEQIKAIGLVFSSSDYGYQKSEITSFINQLEQKRNQLDIKYQKDSKLYRTIFASMAAFIVVLLY